jgi:hypothetical protein
MRRKGLGSELDQKLVNDLKNPIIFKALTPDPGHGYEADVLVNVCLQCKVQGDAKHQSRKRYENCHFSHHKRIPV